GPGGRAARRQHRHAAPLGRCRPAGHHPQRRRAAADRRCGPRRARPHARSRAPLRRGGVGLGPQPLHRHRHPGGQGHGHGPGRASGRAAPDRLAPEPGGGRRSRPGARNARGRVDQGHQRRRRAAGQAV
ncbi:MAG: Molybdate-binding domain of ModE, partial [uncultured Acidimicrobiales bacterium]